MSNIGKPDRETQNRAIAQFRDELRYRYLGDWTARDDNSNFEEELLAAYLTKCRNSQRRLNRQKNQDLPSGLTITH